MPRARFFYRDKNGEPVLFGYYDTETDKVVRLVSDEEWERIRNGVTDRISGAVSDIAMQNPKSAIFNFAK